jgi:hypothetical protein
MRYLWLVAVVVVVSACGNNRPQTGPWPAAVVSTEHFSAAESQTLITALDEMNIAVHRTIVQPDSATSGYPITIVLRGPWDEAPDRAGYATVESDKCTIELSNVIFAEGKKDYIKPVVWHEMGHCAGLQHDPTQGEIMYKASNRLSDYTQASISRFYVNVLSSIAAH